MSIRLVVALLAGSTALASLSSPADAQEVSQLIYLNRCGPNDDNTFTPGPNNAIANTSQIPNQTAVLPPFSRGDQVWNEVVDCVKDLYAPYNVEVTDVDPGTVPHHEAVVCGVAQDLGLGDGIGGIAPGCLLRDNVISFTFDIWGPNALTICEVIGQESAHSYGLEHAFDCTDPMTYLPNCGRKYFRDRANDCGEFETAPCQCQGGGLQNSHRWLESVLGVNPTPIPGPTNTIASPQDGEMVTAGFTLVANAVHTRGLSRVELWLNGTKYAEEPGHGIQSINSPYTLSAPSNLPDSIIDIEFKSYNDIGSETVTALTVTKGGPCTTADTCLDGQSCEDGRCKFPPAVGELGETCAQEAECMSGLCPSVDGEQKCSEFCPPNSTLQACPDGFECLAVDSDTGICWPAKEDSGGCGCEASSGGSPALPTLLAFIGLAFIWRRRQS